MQSLRYAFFFFFIHRNIACCSLSGFVFCTLWAAIVYRGDTFQYKQQQPPGYRLTGRPAGPKALTTIWCLCHVIVTPMIIHHKTTAMSTVQAPLRSQTTLITISISGTSICCTSLLSVVRASLCCHRRFAVILFWKCCDTSFAAVFN